MLTGFLKIIIKDDLHVLDNLTIRVILVGVYCVKGRDYLIDALGSRVFRGWGSSVGGMNVVDSSVPWEVDVQTRGFLKSGLVSARTSNLVANETRYFTGAPLIGPELSRSSQHPWYSVP